MYPILFQLGPITVYTYGFFVFLGVLSAYFVCLSEAKRQGIDRNIFSNIFFWIIILGFLGAKILYILIEFKYFLRSPLSMIRTGFVFYGGIISGIIAGLFFTRRYKISFLKFSDIFSIGIPLAHAFGRLGCFSYGCCYGRPTNSFIGILFPKDSPAGVFGTKVIPTQLIEAFLLILVFFALRFVNRRKKFDGQTFFIYIFTYSALRFVLEFFRGDPRGQIFFLSTSQVISLLLIIMTAVVWRKLKQSA